MFYTTLDELQIENTSICNAACPMCLREHTPDDKSWFSETYLNKEYAPARKMIDSGVAIALSSDYNPGSTPSENYQFTLQLAGNKLRMTPNEILTAATINPAYSLDVSKTIGSLEVGKNADILLLDVKNLDYFIYHYGINHTKAVFKNGKLVVDNREIVRNKL